MNKTLFLSFLLLFIWNISFGQFFKMGTDRALVIGISDYEDENIPDLQFAHKDAEAFAAFLGTKSGGELPDENIKLLTNEKATFGEIYSSLDWLLEESNENDRIIIYFSGHGDVETRLNRQQGFLLAHNTPSNNYRIGALRVEDINAYLETMAQKNGLKIIMITDACRSGKLAGGEVGVHATAQAMAKQYNSEVKIMSCQANEFSLEGEQWGDGRGVFSYYLIDGLTGMADSDKDMQVSLLELRRYLEDAITRETDFKQMPVTAGSMGTRISFVDEVALGQLKGSRDSESSKPDSSSDSEEGEAEDLMYEDFIEALESNYLIKSDWNENREKGKSAEELYNLLIQNEGLKAMHSIIKRNFAAILQDEAQKSISAYLKADPEEMAQREDSTNSKYIRLPKLLNKAAEILGPSHRLYNSVVSKEYYFNGVNRRLRLEKEFLTDSSAFEEALEFIEEALKLDDQAAYLYNERGLIYGNMHNVHKEIENYLKAIEIAPTWVWPLNNACAAYNTSGQYDKAIEMGQKAIKVNSNHYPSFHCLGMVYLKLEKMEEAEKMFLEVQKLSVDFPLLYMEYGIFKLINGKYEEAIQLFEKGVLLDPKEIWFYYNLACSNALLNLHEESLSWLKKALEKGNFEYDTIMEDKDLKNIRDLPEFDSLMNDHFPIQHK